MPCIGTLDCICIAEHQCHESLDFLPENWMDTLCLVSQISEGHVGAEYQVFLGVLNGSLHFSSSRKVRGIVLATKAVERYFVALPHVFQ